MASTGHIYIFAIKSSYTEMKAAANPGEQLYNQEFILYYFIHTCFATFIRIFGKLPGGKQLDLVQYLISGLYSLYSVLVISRHTSQRMLETNIFLIGSI